MASSLSVDIATTFLSLTCRRRSKQALDSRLHATVLPFLPFKTQTPHWSLPVRAERSFNSLRFSNNSASTLRRRFCIATATSTSLSEDSDLATKIPPDNRIPATIITGFLGSGKTTLLNHILTAEHGKRIAVIENEFGEVDIDGSLVAAKTTGAEDIVMLNNGCLCCTVRGDLVRMISELVERKRGKFDHIVIETTGLANPAPIIQTFYAEDSIFNDVKLDGVVTLVDAKHAAFHLDEVKPKGVVNEAVEQIAYADRVIVNKTDLVGEQGIASLVQRIRNINRMAHLKQTQYGKVDLDYVLGIGGFDLERIESAVGADVEKGDHGHDHDHVHDHDHNHEHGHHHDHDHQHDAKKEDDGHDHDHVHDHDCDHELDHYHDHHYQHEHHHSHDHTHDPGVSSVSIVCEGNLDLEKANMWLGTLLYERSEDIYRMKGLLSVQGMDERFVFQGVHDIFQGSPDRLWGQDEPRINKMVFIGKNLDQKEIEKGFRACLL